MRVLLIGGTGFIGTYAIEELQRGGHEVAVFHRLRKHLPASVQQITGDRNHLEHHREEFRRLAPDVVIDFVLSNGSQAKALMDVFTGIAARVVGLSSGDVYRAAGVAHGTELGPLQPVPLTEDSELRTRTNVYGPEILKRLRTVFTWLGDEYDKIPVERALLGSKVLPGTVLRLPLVYGPGDPLHRIFPYLKRMDDGRPFILLEKTAARWRAPRGYVANVAAAIVLAATSDQAAGLIYNVAEPEALSEREWVERIAAETGWRGKVVELLAERMPEHLRTPGNHEQHWTVSSARLREQLGYAESVSAEEAMARTVEWERAHPPEFMAEQFDYPAEDSATAATFSP